MSKKLENRVNLYFNKTQQDVCEYLNNIEDKSAFVVELVRKHMHNEQILGCGVSDNIEYIKTSIEQINNLLKDGSIQKTKNNIKENNNESEKTINLDSSFHVGYNPDDDF